MSKPCRRSSNLFSVHVPDGRLDIHVRDVSNSVGHAVGLVSLVHAHVCTSCTNFTNYNNTLDNCKYDQTLSSVVQLFLCTRAIQTFGHKFPWLFRFGWARCMTRLTRACTCMHELPTKLTLQKLLQHIKQIANMSKPCRRSSNLLSVHGPDRRLVIHLLNFYDSVGHAVWLVWLVHAHVCTSFTNLKNNKNQNQTLKHENMSKPCHRSSSLFLCTRAIQTFGHTFSWHFRFGWARCMTRMTRACTCMHVLQQKGKLQNYNKAIITTSMSKPCGRSSNLFSVHLPDRRLDVYFRDFSDSVGHAVWFVWLVHAHVCTSCEQI